MQPSAAPLLFSLVELRKRLNRPELEPSPSRTLSPLNERGRVFRLMGGDLRTESGHPKRIVEIELRLRYGTVAVAVRKCQ